jgi:hypothetical protein
LFTRVAAYVFLSAKEGKFVVDNIRRIAQIGDDIWLMQQFVKVCNIPNISVSPVPFSFPLSGAKTVSCVSGTRKKRLGCITGNINISNMWFLHSYSVLLFLLESDMIDLFL